MKLLPQCRCTLALGVIWHPIDQSFACWGTKGLAAHCGPSGHQVCPVLQTRSHWHATRKPWALHQAALLIGTFVTVEWFKLIFFFIYLFIFGWRASCSVHWASFHLVSLRPSLPTSYITERVSQQYLSTMWRNGELGLEFGPSFWPWVCETWISCATLHWSRPHWLAFVASKGTVTSDWFPSLKSAFAAA